MIVVTGASGHVGGELVELLAQEKRPVRALVRDRESMAGQAGVMSSPEI